MADIKLVGAVAIKVRPDAKGFRGDTQRQIKKQLAGVDAKVKVKVEADTSEAERDVDRAKDAIEKKGMTLKVGLDHDSVRRAQKQLDSALKGLADEVIKVTFDDEGIAKAQAKLDEMAKDAKVEMTFVPDEKGYKEVLDKIAAIRREKIEQQIEFDIDEDSLDALEREMHERLAESLGRAQVHLTYNENRASLASAIASINNELEKIDAVHIDVDLDEPSLLAMRKELEAKLAGTPIELKVDYDDQQSLKATRDRLREMLSELRSKTLTVGFNEEAIRAELHRINDMIDDEIDDKKKVEIPVHTTGLELVARQLQFASRARRVPFHVVVDTKSVAIAEGILRSLAGVNVLQSAGRGLETLITSFDTIAIKGAGWMAAIGSLADSLVFLASGALTVGGGMAQVIGLTALAPAAFATLASTFLIITAVFKDFGAAAHGINKALELLPPAGQKAAKQFQKVFADMREAISKKFWDAASQPMLDFTNRALPQFTNGLTKTAGRLGKVFGGILDSFTKAGDKKQIDAMFDNLAKMFENASKGATELWDAFNLLGIRGSEFLPEFGDWLTTISTQFHKWLVDNNRMGNVTAWIETGKNSLKDMWRTAGAIIDQFKALSKAAGLIGQNGLDDFRRSMERIADIMEGEPFQTKMASIFFGARRGATELNKGVKDLAGSFTDAAHWTGQLLNLLGKFGGDILSGVSRTIGNLNFQQGLLTSLRGMSEMVETMNPAFDRLGNLIGNVGKVSGAVFPGLGKVFNTAMRILDDALSKVADNLATFAPTLLNLTNNLLGFARGPILFLAEALNNFLEVLNNLPGPLRDTVVAFGAFLLLRNQFGAFASSLSRMWTNLTTTSVKGTAAVATSLDGTGRAFNNVNKRLVIMSDGSVRQMNRFGNIMSGGISRANASVGRFNPTTITGKLGAVVGGVAGAVGKINTSLALIGGIPGLILGGLGIVLATIGGNAADAAANIDELRESLDKVTGGNTPETLGVIAKHITSIDEAGDSWANFWRGVIQGAQAGNETLGKLKINVSDAAKAVAGSQKDFDAFVGTLDDLRAAENIGGFKEFLQSGKLPGDTTLFDPSNINGKGQKKLSISEQDIATLRAGKEAFDKLGISIENLPDGASIDVLTGKMREQREQLELARLGQAIYADALGTTIDRAREVASIVETIGDRSLDAAGKIDAINRSLELLNGTGLSQQEAKIARLDALDVAVENAKSIAKSIAASKDVIFNANGLINEQSKAGRDLFKIMSEAADNVKIQAQSTYDAAIKNGETAQAAADKARAVVKSGDDDLKRIAQASGLTVEQLKAQWSKFFGDDWTLEATFSANTDNFMAGQAEAQRLGVEFDGKKFMAWLLANPDPAKVTTDQVKQYIRDYASAKYQAQLTAINPQALAIILQATGSANLYARGDYTAVMEAINNAGPGAAAAWQTLMNVKGGPGGAGWQAAFTAFLDSISAAGVDAALNAIANQRRVAVISVQYADAKPGSVGTAGRGTKFANRNGSIMDGSGNGMFGFNPERMRFYANGGIEKHIASIFPASANVRVFAEPETGGEAYIPLAASKRPRSVAILSEVARMFGYSLTRAQAYSNGGGYGRANPTTNNTASVHIGTLVTTDADAAVKKIRTSQQDALAVAGISLNGA